MSAADATAGPDQCKRRKATEPDRTPEPRLAPGLYLVATPIGAGCRVCERDNCPQRAFPALGRALDIDEHRSTVSPYLVRPA